jgi:hypothetical protein
VHPLETSFWKMTKVWSLGDALKGPGSRNPADPWFRFQVVPIASSSCALLVLVLDQLEIIRHRKLAISDGVGRC